MAGTHGTRPGAKFIFLIRLHWTPRELKPRAEKQRVQGSVFKIQSIPILLLEYPSSTFGLVPINEAGSLRYDRLLTEITNDQSANFWRHFPEPDQHWLLCFVVRDLPNAIPKFVPQRTNRTTMARIIDWDGVRRSKRKISKNF
jgi:hypothetical protein